MDIVASHRAARAAHEQLIAALRELENAEQNAVLRFAEILHEQHFRVLGFASIWHYGIEGLGFSKSKTAQFVRLAKDVKRLPSLERALTENEIDWTKAREIGKVATVESQDQWIARAKAKSRRELEADVRKARKQALGAAASARATEPSSPGTDASGGTLATTNSSPVATLPVESPSPAESLSPAAPAAVQASFIATDELPQGDTVLRVSFELTALELATFEKLVEKAQRAAAKRHRSRAALLLSAFDALVRGTHDAAGVQETNKPAAECTRVHSSPALGHASPATSARPVPSAPPVQVVVHRCDSCQKVSVPTDRGNLPLSAAEASTATCDAMEFHATRRSRSRIPRKIRLRVLARDGQRCRICRSTRFVDVHHQHKEADGGPHTVENCMSLCRACHVNTHREEELLERGVALEREVTSNMGAD